MENKVYKLLYLPLFVSDMEEMLDYFMFNFKNPDAASHFLDQVETAIRKRLNYPEAFEPYDGRAMVGKYPYYRIYVGNYTIYYVVIEDVMEVRRILYSKRNMEQILDK